MTKWWLHRKGSLKSIGSFFSCLTKSFTGKIHVRISIPKQYRMMMSSVARVEFIKTKVFFWYHTKGVSNWVSSDSDHEIKSYSCSNFITKIEKNEKVGNIFWVTNGEISGLQIGARRITNRGCFRYFKSG